MGLPRSVDSIAMELLSLTVGIRAFNFTLRGGTTLRSNPIDRSRHRSTWQLGLPGHPCPHSGSMRVEEPGLGARSRSEVSEQGCIQTPRGST